MKKNLLAASLALALGTMAGTASAALTVNEGGIGHLNIVPYYSVQDGNNTLLTITNTDQINGKVVKVRFRAAEWSDDALDFQVFLSPADVWTAAFGMVDGQLKLVTSDNSCTLPLNISGQEFTAIRVEGGNVNNLKEGYVEIFDVADIRPKGVADVDYAVSDEFGTNPLYTAIKHVNGVAPCTPSLLNNLVEDSTRAQGQVVGSAGLAVIDFAPGASDLVASKPEYQRSWMAPPTGGLTTSATIIAVDESKAFTVPAVAIGGEPLNAAGSNKLTADYAVVQYFRQSNDQIFDGTQDVAAWTADRLFWPVNATLVDQYTQLGAGYPTYQFDLPDVSTPFWHSTHAASTPTTAGGVLPTTQRAESWRNEIANLLRKGTVVSDYVVDQSVGATTDIVLSQPVRRYFYSYTPSSTDFNRTIRNVTWRVGGQQSTTYQPIVTASNTIVIGGPNFFDREERTPTNPSGIVVSPQEPGVVQQVTLKGETSVVSIKHGAGVTGSLGARLTNTDWSYTENYQAGWLSINLNVVGTIIGSAATQPGGANPYPATTGATWQGDTRLPVVGFTAINVFNASAGANGTNYGLALPLRY